MVWNLNRVITSVAAEVDAYLAARFFELEAFKSSTVSILISFS
jgi:hypothetical protein